MKKKIKNKRKIEDTESIKIIDKYLINKKELEILYKFILVVNLIIVLIIFVYF